MLYLASIFPNTLLPMSVYALARGASAILFSQAVGWYIDTRDRLRVVRVSIGMLPYYAERVMSDDSSISEVSCSGFLCCVLVTGYWADGAGVQAMASRAAFAICLRGETLRYHEYYIR